MTIVRILALAVLARLALPAAAGPQAGPAAADVGERSRGCTHRIECR